MALLPCTVRAVEAEWPPGCYIDLCACAMPLPLFVLRMLRKDVSDLTGLHNDAQDSARKVPLSVFAM